jgi:hypothetical protein
MLLIFVKRANDARYHQPATPNYLDYACGGNQNQAVFTALNQLYLSRKPLL